MCVCVCVCVSGNRMASEDLSLLDQVASELLLLQPPPLLCPGARLVYQPLYDTCTHTHTCTCLCAHIAGQYISLSVTSSVCVSPIIWPLDSNGWERRVGFPCGLNTTAFITHNRSSILARQLTGETEVGGGGREKKKQAATKGIEQVVSQEIWETTCTLLFGCLSTSKGDLRGLTRQCRLQQKEQHNKK